MSSRSAGDTALAVFLLSVTAITVAYWIVWYLVPGGEQMLSVLPGDAAHKRFEDAFLAADLWMAFAAAVAALRLLTDATRASAWLYMAGSAGLYLAGMDILYDVQNGIYGLASNPAQKDAVVTEMVINAGTLLFSILSIARGRRTST
jgi:hypothetical protein